MEEGLVEEVVEDCWAPKHPEGSQGSETLSRRRFVLEAGVGERGRQGKGMEERGVRERTRRNDEEGTGEGNEEERNLWNWAGGRRMVDRTVRW